MQSEIIEAVHLLRSQDPHLPTKGTSSCSDHRSEGVREQPRQEGAVQRRDLERARAAGQPGLKGEHQHDGAKEHL